MAKRVAFLYIDSSYMVYHSISVAIALSLCKDVVVDILCSSRVSKVVHNMLSEVEHKCKIKELKPYWQISLPMYMEIKLQLRIILFFKYRKLFNSYGAVVCSLYNDLLLRKHLSNTKLIFANHGIANRSYSYDKKVLNFDKYFILDGKEMKKRKQLGHLEGDRGVYTGFLKGDAVRDRKYDKIFSNSKTTYLYNPHWEPTLTSYHKFGKALLKYFKNHKEYNLIFAPHSLLPARNYNLRSQWKELQSENIHIDHSSESCNDMTYTKQADVYIGDISSQVYEFLHTDKKPCIFLDAHELVDRPISWSLGPVISSINDLINMLPKARKEHKETYIQKQENVLAQTFLKTKSTSTSIAVDEVIAMVDK